MLVKFVYLYVLRETMVNVCLIFLYFLWNIIRVKDIKSTLFIKLIMIFILYLCGHSPLYLSRYLLFESIYMSKKKTHLLMLS